MRCSSADAAAVFAALRFTSLRRRVANVLAVESGLNETMAAALTIGLVSWTTKPHHSGGDIVLLLVRQFWLGLALGIGIGLVASRLLPVIPAEQSGFASVATVATAAVAYGATDAAAAFSRSTSPRFSSATGPRPTGARSSRST